MRKFSIIIPVYNTEKYLEKCISSVINQKYKNFEVILIDDGSKDNSGAICDEYAKKDNKVKVIHQINAGVSTARNVGIKNANGKYIIFLDSDDSLNGESLTRLNDIIEKNEEIDCILYNVDGEFKDGMYKEEKLKSLIVQLIITEKINPPWNKVYKRNIIEENNIVFDKNIQIGEDLLFSITYLSYANNICILNEELYNYTVDNSNSLTRKYKENKYKQLMYVDDEIRKYLQTFQSKKILECALQLQEAGVFAVVLELLPEESAKYITQNLKIPTIGIGAGVNCDGQIVVSDDILGKFTDFKPKFVKNYADLHSITTKAFENYIHEVKSCEFPAQEQVFDLDEEEKEKLLAK